MSSLKEKRWIRFCDNKSFSYSSPTRLVKKWVEDASGAAPPNPRFALARLQIRSVCYSPLRTCWHGKVAINPLDGGFAKRGNFSEQFFDNGGLRIIRVNEHG